MAIKKAVAQENGETIYIDMTPEEQSAFDTQRSLDNAAESSKETIAEAKNMLSKKDIVVNRCIEKGIPVPKEWSDYADSLRSIVKSGIGPLPNQPIYPLKSQ